MDGRTVKQYSERMDKNKFFLGLMVVAVGLFMAIQPDVFSKVAVIILGLVAIFNGVFILYTARNLIIDENYASIMTIRGCMSVGVGVLSVLLPVLIQRVFWTIMTYTLAVYLLASAVMESYTISKLKRNGYAIRQAVIEVVASVVLALVLFIIKSERIGDFIVRFGGVVLVLIGVGLSLLQWRNRPIVMDAVVVDDEEEAAAESEPTAED